MTTSSPEKEPTSPPPPENESEEGEDLMVTNKEDYKEMPSQDQYDPTHLDPTEYKVDPIARREAEKEMAERDRKTGRGQRTFIPRALMDKHEEIPESLLKHRFANNLTIDDDKQETDGLVNLEDFTGPLRTWLDEDRVRREIKYRFKNFLTTFSSQKRLVYPPRIAKMCQENRSSLEILYDHLAEFAPILAIWVADVPSVLLELFDEVVMDVVQRTFPDYNKIHDHINTRVAGLSLCDALRELRQLHLNAFVKVTGVVTRRTIVFPELQRIKYDCIKCGYIIGPFGCNSNSLTNKNNNNNNNKNNIPKPNSCPDCNSSGPFKLNESLTIYRNYQKLTLQESPGSVPAGRIPRSKDIIVVNDLCDTIRPGEQIQVTGILKNIYNNTYLNIQQGFPVFSTIIEANHILKEKDYLSEFEITEDDKLNIIKLSKKHNIEEIIIKSVAPSIYGHEYIKRAILYALLGGMEKNHTNKHRVRGDINILILGDPGVAKSQFLKYTEKIAFRSVYATGKGASAVGLTASVRRDTLTKEWTLEGGALVLADRGVCLIDEFDKMNDSDRVSIHEAMEQQTISISKAGIIASLQARCAIIAAANPIKGRYDGSLTFLENVDLTDPILSRFDILTVVRDKVDLINDQKLASFVVDNHMKYHPDIMNEYEETEEKEIESFNINNPKLEMIPQSLLRKYILYCKKYSHPKLDNINRDKIASFYSDLRQKSMQGGGIPIAVRHIESILRISEARAKLHLREYVRSDDVDMAISVILQSFIQTQKQSVQNTLKKYFEKYLIYKKDTIQLLNHILLKEINEEMNWRGLNSKSDEVNMGPIFIDVKDLKNKAQSLNITSLQEYFESDLFKNEGFKIIQNGTVIQKKL